MPEIFRLWMVYQCVDNDQIAVLCRCLPDEEMVPTASGRGIEGGGGMESDNEVSFMYSS